MSAVMFGCYQPRTEESGKAAALSSNRSPLRSTIRTLVMRTSSRRGKGRKFRDRIEARNGPESRSPIRCRRFKNPGKVSTTGQGDKYSAQLSSFNAGRSKDRARTRVTLRTLATEGVEFQSESRCKVRKA
ncbi:hypothetical protein VTL71DRAFT_3975 [Oculimacula yallundae]|uniref:Uncharacterized protein n=1 Tax=Oculimacula yallundae TaxID=86028 RepID=A0ABR4C4J4_9HELO